MADSSLAEYIKANKIKPNRRGGAQVANKGAKNKKPGQQKPKKQQGVKKVQNGKQQGGIKKAKNAQRGGFKSMRGQATRGRGQARGNWRPRAAANVARTFKPTPVRTGPAKIKISNLDFGVSDQDLKDLFSEFGSLKMASIHYNAQGASMGVAHLVYGRGADAAKAMKQYNGVALDGRPMRLQLEGGQQQQLTGALNRPKTLVKRLTRGAAPVGRGRGGQRGRGGARGKGPVRGQKATRGQGATRGRGGAKRGRGGNRGNKTQQNKKQQKPKPPTVEELDAQLDAYINSKA